MSINDSEFKKVASRHRVVCFSNSPSATKRNRLRIDGRTKICYISKANMTKSDFLFLLSATVNGLTDIISVNWKGREKAFEDIKINDFYNQYVFKHPACLKGNIYVVNKNGQFVVTRPSEIEEIHNDYNNPVIGNGIISREKKNPNYKVDDRMHEMWRRFVEMKYDRPEMFIDDLGAYIANEEAEP